MKLIRCSDRLTLIPTQKQASINDYSASLGVPDHVYIGPSFFKCLDAFPNSQYDFQAVLSNQTEAGLQNTIEVTKRIKPKLGDRLNLVEVGNEPNGYPRWCRDKSYTQQDYVNEWRTRADIMSTEVFNCHSGEPCWANFQGLVLAEYGGFTM